MTQPMKKMLIGVGIFFGLVFGWYGIKKIIMIWYMSHYQPPAVTVSSGTAVNKIWQSYLTSVGNVTAVNGIDLTAEVAGIVKATPFTAGQSVKQGDTLIILDASVEQAELKNNMAKLKLAQVEYERNKKLFAKNVLPQSSLDVSFAQLQQAEASVESTQARIQQKTIVAPFNGKVGIPSVSIGEYISPGLPLVTLQALNPLQVKFHLGEQYVADLYVGQTVDVSMNVANGKTVRGILTSLNTKVDPATRTILAEATMPNEKFEFYPGMFAVVKIWLKEQKNTLVIPETAVSYSLHGDYVFVIKDENKTKKKDPQLQAYRQFVKVLEHRDNEVAVAEGIKAGERVVTAGQLKLQEGSHVMIDNTVELK